MTIDEILTEAVYGGSEELRRRVRLVLALLQHWEDTRWRKEGRESEWTRLMIREVRAALDGEQTW